MSTEQQLFAQAQQQLNSVIVGKDTVIKQALSCLLASGHLLLEDVPGVGKTSLAQALSKVLDFSYSRVQFTNDFLPADLLGFSLFKPNTGNFEFKKGPIFTQLLLADEINRAPPKSQSALLEAMEEAQVSVDGESYILPKSFWVIATQNPTTSAGTFPLPESQSDRFLMSLSMGYPDPENEKLLLVQGSARQRFGSLSTVLTEQQVLSAQGLVAKVHASAALIDYIYEILSYSRDSGLYELGLSPRAGLGLVDLAKAWAWLSGRDYVQPDDVQAVLPGVVRHRLQFKAQQSQYDSVVQPLMANVAIP